jgi:hypothetical protein
MYQYKPFLVWLPLMAFVCRSSLISSVVVRAARMPRRQILTIVIPLDGKVYLGLVDECFYIVDRRIAAIMSSILQSLSFIRPRRSLITS